MSVDVLLGLQWGDEGKGKIVDFLAPQYQLVARFQGGPNAGHTLIVDGRKIVLHHIPSGVFHERPLNLIGNGMVLNPADFKAEAEKVETTGIDLKSKLLLSRKAHLILPTHRELDAAMETAKGNQKIGSTLRGIGPVYTDKISRNGLRIGDLEAPDFGQRYQAAKTRHLEVLQQFNHSLSDNFAQAENLWMEGVAYLRKLRFVNGEQFVNETLKQGGSILAEGAQGAMLDIDYGTYPYVTSSNTITAGVCTGLGVAPHKIREVYGISKAYCTRVGGGPFPTELTDEVGERLRQAGGEFGATTGRPRRCGWIDLPALRYAIMLSGVTRLIITKADVLNDFGQIKAGIAYTQNGQSIREFPYRLTPELQASYKSFDGWQNSLEGISTFGDMPENLRQYLAYLENDLQTPVTMVSTGPERHSLIHKSSDATVAF